MGKTAEPKIGRGRPRTRPVTAVGQRMIRLCDKRGWTLRQLADESGVSFVTVYDIVGGRAPDPRVSTVRALADALGTTLDRLWPRAAS